MSGGPSVVDVLILVSSDPRYDARSTKYLRSLLSAGFSARLIGVSSDGTAERSGEVVRVPVARKSGKGFFLQFYRGVIPEAMATSAKLVIAGDLFSLIPSVANKYRHSGKKRPVRLIYDSKELYDALPSLKVKRSSFLFWHLVENSSLRWIDAVFTVNQSIAEILESKWNLPVTVLRNVPAIVSPTPAARKSLDRIFLTFSGGLQGGRGLFDLLELLTLLPARYELRFVGDGAMKDELIRRSAALNIQERVHFIGRVRQEEVVAELSKGHLGIYLMENTGLCHYLALPNKLFQFISAGLPVIVPHFPEMERIVNEYSLGAAVDTSDLKSVAAAVIEMTSSPDIYQGYAARSLEASSVLNWQAEEKKFIDAVSRLI